MLDITDIPSQEAFFKFCNESQLYHSGNPRTLDNWREYVHNNPDFSEDLKKKMIEYSIGQ